MPERYFYHPESDCLFTTQGDTPSTDGLVEEITFVEYEELRGEQRKCTLCAGLPSPGFYTGCMIMDGHVPDSEWDCDGQGNLTRATDPCA